MPPQIVRCRQGMGSETLLAVMGITGDVYIILKNYTVAGVSVQESTRKGCVVLLP